MAKRSGEAAVRTVRAAPATANFDGTCNGLKGRGLVFDAADAKADQLSQVKREIVEYIGKDYQNGGACVGPSRMRS